MLIKGFHEDENVVRINHHYAFRNEVFEDVIYHCLEGSRTVFETEEHDEGFVKATVRSEGSFPLVALLCPDVVETPPNIQFCEVIGSTELGDQLRNEWKQVLIFHGYGVQHVVVLHQTKLSILLFNKEDWGGHRRLRGADPSRVEVLFEEGVQLFLLRGREWVNLAALWRSICDELHCVIPGFEFRQFIKQVLGEDGGEITEVRWDVVTLVCHRGVLLETFR